jgi:predicted Rossmann fold flavoprotein
MQVVVIGGGAAGFFAAIQAKRSDPDADVVLLEKSDKLLGKVRISGGGRCNVTHHCFGTRQLAAHYPRGERFLRKAFTRFGASDTVAWFAAQGVELKTEPDGRMFPVTDSSSTVIDCLMDATRSLGVSIRMRTGVARIELGESERFVLKLENNETLPADKLIVTIGGQPKADGYALLGTTGHTIIPPAPSLFTFNMPDEPVRELMGVTVAGVRTMIAGTDLESTGPLLVTHWGMSGPAILRLSAWGARTVKAMGYQFTLRVDWSNGAGEGGVRALLDRERTDHPRKRIGTDPILGLPRRLWEYLLNKADIPTDKPWAELGGRQGNRLVDLLTNDRYAVRGKTTFKEEFVTAGGVSLDEVDPATMESRKVPGLHFAGEVLDIDGITGGFNFQAAWTTGFLAGSAAVLSAPPAA